jgi:trk system potassium uptake protein TrkA
MNVIVVGCGRVGAEVAYGLFRKGHKVTVVDQEAAAFRNLPPDFRGLTLRGDVLTQDVLLRAGIEHAQALAAVTPSDSVNTVLGHVAQVVFKVPNVVVRNFDPRKRVLHEAFNLDLISPSSMGAQCIEELLGGARLRKVCPGGAEDVGLYQFTVPKAWRGRLLGDLLTSTHGTMISVTRGGRLFPLKPDGTLEPGDVLHLSATKEGARILGEQLDKLQEA